MIQLQQAVQIASIAILVYLLVNRAVRRQPWSSLGFTPGYAGKLAQNWHLVLLVAVLLQIAVPALARLYEPELLTHIGDRLPSSGPVAVVLTILIGTFMEELVYRVFLQRLLRRIMPAIPAIALAAIMFACAHWSQADDTVLTLLDVGLVFVDGLIYGFIFERSGNVTVAWSAHAAADIVGLIMLSLLV